MARATEESDDGATTRGARWQLPGGWLWASLRLPFVLVYLVGLCSEVGAFWRIDPGTTTLLVGAFSAFGLLASVCFGLVRALPPGANEEARLGLAAGWRALHAAVLSLCALMIVHGFTERWPGMQLLAGYPATDVLLRAVFVALGVGAASTGLLALWRIDALVTRPAVEPT